MKEYFTEVKCDYKDPENGFWTVDAWRSDDPDAEGEVIAVICDATGGVFIRNVDAYLSPMAQEVIKEKVAEIKARERKVWVVTINEVYDFEQFDHDPVVFDNLDAAQKYLAQAREEAIEDYSPDDEDETGNVIDTDRLDYFVIYKQHSWSETHYEIGITECKIASK